MTIETRTALVYQLKRARQLVNDISAGRREWTMRVPVDPDDPDMVFADALNAAIAALDASPPSLPTAPDTYTPCLWATMTDDQRYEEYIRVRKLLASLPTAREVQLGVIEFHSDRVNPGLRERFSAVTDDLRESGSIVDLWLMDIATVLAEFGYQMRVTTDKLKPTAALSSQEPPT